MPDPVKVSVSKSCGLHCVPTEKYLFLSLSKFLKGFIILSFVRKLKS